MDTVSTKNIVGRRQSRRFTICPESGSCPETFSKDDRRREDLSTGWPISWVKRPGGGKDKYQDSPPTHLTQKNHTMIVNQSVSLSVNLRLACDLILPSPLSLKTTVSTRMIRAVFFVVRLKFCHRMKSVCRPLETRRWLQFRRKSRQSQPWMAGAASNLGCNDEMK
jgi:hypothetical protein